MGKRGNPRWGMRILLILLLLLFGLPILTLIIIRWRTTAAWNEFRTRWEAQGEQFDLADHLPRPPPDEENLARHPRFIDLHLAGSPSSAWFDTIDLKNVDGCDPSEPTGVQRELCRNADFAAWTNIPPDASPEERLAEITTRLAPFDTGLDEIAQALAERPRCQFDLDWNQPYLVETDHVFTFMNLAKSFSARASLRIATGHSAGATDDILTLHNLASAAGGDPTLIGYLVALGIDALAINTLWDGLDRQVFTEPDLQRIDRRLGTVPPFPERLLPVLRFERGGFLHLTAQLETDPGALTGAPGSTDMTGLRGLVFRSLLSASRLGGCEDLQETVLAPHGSLVTRPAWRSFEEWERRLEVRWSGPRKFIEALAAMATPALGSSGRKAYEMEALIHHARLAVALERHRLAKGSYPPALGDLLPGLLPAVPQDQINARPIEYRLKPDGTPLLYQWGFDGDDDGGTPRKDSRHGDLVWQYSLPAGFTEADWRSGN